MECGFCGKVGGVGMRLIDADALADALFEKHKNYPQWVADTIGNMQEAVVRCNIALFFTICFCVLYEMG